MPRSLIPPSRPQLLLSDGTVALLCLLFAALRSRARCRRHRFARRSLLRHTNMVPSPPLRLLISLVTALFLVPRLHASTADARWTDFEMGFGGSALNSARLHECLGIQDPGFRARCSLLAALDAEAAAAVTDDGGDDSEAGSRKWDQDRRESCAYREQGGPALHKFAAKMHPYLKQVLEKYATLHRQCTGLEYEKLAGMYAGKKRKSPQCRYVVWSCTFGLGNKLMSLLSTFLYAILSQRVLLIDSSGWERLFCEPFPGSPLQVPKGFSLRETASPSFAAFRNRSGSPYVVEVAFTGESQPEDHSFLVCPTAMASVREIPILHFRNSNQHFAVGFFLNPALRPLLEVLFPEHNVFHMLAQEFMSPSDGVWAEVRRWHERNRGAWRSVGVQLRESKGEYRGHYDAVVPLCIQSKAALCPIELQEQTDREATDSNATRPVVAVFVSSLAGGHFHSLRRSLAKLEPLMHQRFVVVAQEADGEQREDIGHMQKALVDIWILSLSDILLTSHMSTFGYTAHGLGGITPFHLKPWLDNVCWLSASSDPCFHFAPHHVSCGPFDNFTLTNPLLQARYIVSCPDLPNTGLQLVE